ncbi:hypothetical protein IR010_01190 [Flavobacterium sp. MR2016-29]|uniref:hypothetical protein n=1 Tax=Flavobacterium sp. MR2016-29 TaxID=2783795 RepID=UPI00188D13F7|nr:hypothetical protein [Flavobacterium sp. MR2016-29]MBF4491139.1 hypothetical protein [Flavobacterium sp. MR2016-29]
MKQIYCLALFALLFSCKENKETNSENLNKSAQKDTLSVKEINTTASKENFESDLRPSEKLKLGQPYSDTVEFVEFDNNGDFPLFSVQKNKKLVGLVSNSEDAPKFKRGDVLELKWKMDTLYVAGESEELNFSEWMISAKKVKDGNVSLFLKKYKKPIKYSSAKEDYTDGFKDYLYTQVEYYLANSKQELVKTAIKNPDADLSYSIEEKDKEGHIFYVLGISNDFEHHTNIIQWIYIDSNNNQLYEYDLPNDKLVEFN